MFQDCTITLTLCLFIHYAIILSDNHLLEFSNQFHLSTDILLIQEIRTCEREKVTVLFSYIHKQTVNMNIFCSSELSLCFFQKQQQRTKMYFAAHLRSAKNYCEGTLTTLFSMRSHTTLLLKYSMGVHLIPS